MRLIFQSSRKETFSICSSVISSSFFLSAFVLTFYLYKTGLSVFSSYNFVRPSLTFASEVAFILLFLFYVFSNLSTLVFCGIFCLSFSLRTLAIRLFVYN